MTCGRPIRVKIARVVCPKLGMFECTVMLKEPSIEL